MHTIMFQLEEEKYIPPYYVISEEVQKFLQSLSIVKSKDDGLSNDEKIILKIYYFLKEIKRVLYSKDLELIRERFYNELNKLDLNESSVKQVVDSMSELGITSKYYGLLSDSKPFEIKSESKYDIYLDEKLFNPICSSLLDKKEEIINIKVTPTKLSKIKEKLGILSDKERYDLYLQIGLVELELREFIKEGLGVSCF